MAKPLFHVNKRGYLLALLIKVASDRGNDPDNP